MVNVLKKCLLLFRIMLWWPTQIPKWHKVEGITDIIYQNDFNDATLELRLRLAPILQWLVPAISACERCHWPWYLVESHTTQLTPNTGLFCLCTLCWQKLSHSVARLPFYRSTWEKYW